MNRQYAEQTCKIHGNPKLNPMPFPATLSLSLSLLGWLTRSAGRLKPRRLRSSSAKILKRCPAVNDVLIQSWNRNGHIVNQDVSCSGALGLGTARCTKVTTAENQARKLGCKKDHLHTRVSSYTRNMFWDLLHAMSRFPSFSSFRFVDPITTACCPVAPGTCSATFARTWRKSRDFVCGEYFT